MTLSALLIAFALGLAFGALLQRVQASAPDRVLATLQLQDLTILKFMLLAIGVGAAGIGALTAAGMAHLNIKPLALAAVALGGVVFGAGFALGGYCPGTCLAGAAEGRRDALFVILGGLVGVLAYSLAFPWLNQHVIAAIDLGKPTLVSVTGLHAGAAGIGFGLLMTAVAFLLPTHPHRRRAHALPPSRARTAAHSHS